MAVKVYLWESLARFTDNKTELTIDADTVDELIYILSCDYPGLNAFFRSGFSIAINDEITNPDFNDLLPENAEIFLLQKLKGG